VPVSKEGKEIKITDKRMFTPDGKLREEYRFLEEKSTAAPAAPAAPAEAPAAAAGSGAAASPRPPGARPAEDAAAPHGGAPRPASGRSSGRGAAGRGEAPGPALAGAAGPAPGAPSGRSGRGEAPPPAGAGGAADEPGARLELPGTAPGLGPSFYDLAAMLAEPVAIYLGDMELPDGQSAENLEMARLYIDLLDVLRQKTAGNLTAQESAFLEDLLYRLRVRYVQKRG